MQEIPVTEFRKTILRFCTKQNLDPVFDLKYVDNSVLKVFLNIFSSANINKDIKDFFPNYSSGNYIYDKGGVFNHFSKEGHLSTRNLGMDAIHFAKALIRLGRSELKDIKKEELFIPIVLKWHVGAAILTSDMFGLEKDKTILCWEPSIEEFNESLNLYIEKEWNDWAKSSNPISSYDEFYDERILIGEDEAIVRDIMQEAVINRAIENLRINHNK